MAGNCLIADRFIAIYGFCHPSLPKVGFLGCSCPAVGTLACAEASAHRVRGGRWHWVPNLAPAGDTVLVHGSHFSVVGESFCLSTESSLKPPALSRLTAGVVLLKLQFLHSSAGDSVV